MSQCFTLTSAAIKLADPSVSVAQLLSHLEDVIAAEARSHSFDANTVYAQLAHVFDIEGAFDPFVEDAVDYADHFQLKVEDGTVILDGVPQLNADDHVTRWVAWVLFREFGAGDILTFTSETLASESISRCLYELSRDGQVSIRVFDVAPEDDC